MDRVKTISPWMCEYCEAQNLEQHKECKKCGRKRDKK